MSSASMATEGNQEGEGVMEAQGEGWGVGGGPFLPPYRGMVTAASG